MHYLFLAKPKIKHRDWCSLPLSIEWPKGCVRTGHGKNGPWKRTMHCDYGYVRKTEGKDGDAIDCYVQQYEPTAFVYVVEQQDPETKKTDEYKCLLGCKTESEARKLYLKHYPSKDFLKSVSKIPTHEFVEKIKSGRYDRTKIASLLVDHPMTIWTAKAAYYKSADVHALRLVKQCDRHRLEHEGRVLGHFMRLTDDQVLRLLPEYLTAHNLTVKETED